jgi:hypothetical protein
LLPIYYLIIEPKPTSIKLINPFTYLKNLKYLPAQAVSILIATAVPLLAYFLFHYIHFGNILPNTFYAKSSSSFCLGNFIHYAFFIIPTVLLLYLNDRIKLAIFVAIMFGAMALSYSTSSLQMDYAGRFAFHIFAPIYAFWIYFASKLDGHVFISLHDDFIDAVSVKRQLLFSYISLFFLIFFTYISSHGLLNIATYYPRGLHSHAEFGKVLNRISDRYGIRSLAIGDAGMAPYYSDINVLDIVGLGSATVARHGISPSILDKYKVDVIAFFANKDGIKFNDYNQQAVYDWAVSNNFKEIGDIYWRPDYMLRIYSRKPINEIEHLCKTSKYFNDIPDRNLLKEAICYPPWKYWIG